MSSEAIDRVSRTEDAMDGQQRIAYGVQLHSRDHPLINRGEPRQTARVTTLSKTMERNAHMITPITMSITTCEAILGMTNTRNT